MQTLTPEQYKAKYGDSGAWSQTVTSTLGRPTITDTIANAFKSGIDQAKSGVQQVGNGGGNPVNLVEGIGKVGSGLVSAAMSPAAPILEPTVGKAIHAVADKISNLPVVQRFADSKAGQATSRVSEDVGNYANIAGAVGGAMEVPSAATAITDTAKKGISAVQDTASEALNAATSKIHPTIDTATQLLKDATPDYSKKLVGEAPIKTAGGTVPRVQEGGLIKGRTVTPTKLETEAASELAKVPGYPISGTSLEKFHAIQPEITTRGEALMTSLRNENILRPPQQISKVISDAINKVPEQSLLLQKSDPVISNYMRVAKNAITQTDGTLAGELRVRQLLDSAYKNARGKMAFGSDKLSALDDIHTAARDALNKDIIEKAQNTDVKASLKAQWDLMRASDVLRTKAETEAGSSMERYFQNHPTVKKLIKPVATAAGFGAGTHLLP